MINYILHVYLSVLIKSKPVFYDPEHMKINIHFKPICATTYKNVYPIYIFIVLLVFVIIIIDIYVVVIVVVLRGYILESIINRLVHLCINMEWVCTNYTSHANQIHLNSYRIQAIVYKYLSHCAEKKHKTKWTICYHTRLFSVHFDWLHCWFRFNWFNCF